MPISPRHHTRTPDDSARTPHRMTRTRRLTTVTLPLAAALAFTGCASSLEQPTPESSAASSSSSASAQPGSGSDSASVDAALDRHGLDGLGAAEIIDRLDHTPIDDRPSDLTASVEPDDLVITADDAETRLPMPQDKFYLAVAPYLQKTHDCYFHSPTNCVGEQRNTEVEVTITDKTTNEVVHHERTHTLDNGFFSMWLPRGLDGTLTVETDGHSATMPVSTAADDDPTCITSLQLS